MINSQLSAEGQAFRKLFHSVTTLKLTRLTDKAL